MTTPLAAAAPAPTPTAVSSPTQPTAATGTAGGGERFASALDDAVTSGRGGPRGQERAAETERTAETEGAAADPTAEVPDAERPAPTEPAVSGTGMPPGLWALLSGIGPGAPGPVDAVAHAAAGSAVGEVGMAATVAASGPTVAPIGPDGVPAAAPPAGVPVPGATELPAGAAGVPGLPVADAVLPGSPGTAAATPATAAITAAAGADPLPGLTVVLAGPEAPVTPTAPELVAPDTVVPLPPPAAPAAAEGAAPDTGSAPEQDTPPPAPAPAAATTAAAPGPAVPPAAPVPLAGPTAPVAPAPPVSGQVAQQVAVLRTAPDGTHTMTVVLTPETLGPVEVQVTLSRGVVDLSLRSATEAGRAALLEALPDLRRDLAGAGLTCTNASVDRDAGGSWTAAQQHAAGDRAGRHGQPDGRGRPWLRGTDVDAGRSAPVSTAVPSSGLDVRV